MTDYKINDTQIKSLFDALINFDSKGFYEIMDQVKENPVRSGNPGLDQALNEGDGSYTP